MTLFAKYGVICSEKLREVTSVKRNGVTDLSYNRTDQDMFKQMLNNLGLWAFNCLYFLNQ